METTRRPMNLRPMNLRNIPVAVRVKLRRLLLVATMWQPVWTFGPVVRHLPTREDWRRRPTRKG